MKKIFKVAIVALLAGAALLHTGCTKDYSGEITDLKTQVNTLSTKVDGLQAQIDAGAIVTKVESVADGIVITLSNGKTYSITNGKDGKDGKDGVDGTDGKDGKDGKDGANGKDGKDGSNGKDGKNGTVCTIGADGYWYLDGVKTEYCAQGKDGKDGKDGVDGKDGKDGDTIYYYPNCEKNVWVKVVNGVETETTNPVYVPGTIAAVWSEGSLIVYNVEGVDGPLTIKLHGALKSLAFVPSVIYDGLGCVEFPYAFVMPEEGGDTVFVKSSEATGTFRVNPGNANVSAYDFSVIARSVYTKAAGDLDKLITITKKEFVDDVVTVTLVANQAINSPKHKANNIVAALVAEGENETIVSDYIYVSTGALNKDYKILDKPNTTPTDPVFYRDYEPSVQEEADTTLSWENPRETEKINLLDCVDTWACEVEALLSAYGMTATYEFSVVDNDAADFIVLSGNNVWINYTKEKTASVGAKPVVKVVSKYTEGEKTYTLATAYIMIEILGDFEHSFAIDNYKLNPDYVLGTMKALNFTIPADTLAKPANYNTYGGVRIKGRETEMVSGILEHFENYLLSLNEEDATLTFQIVNFNVDEVIYTDPANPSDYTISTYVDANGKDHSQVTMTKDQLKAMVARESSIPDIKLVGAAINTNKDVLVRVIEECTDSEAHSKGVKVKKGYYYVVFEAATFEVEVNPIILKTLKETPDSAYVKDVVTIREKASQKELFKYNPETDQFEATEYAVQTYFFEDTDVAEVTFEKIIYDATGKDAEATFGNCLNIVSDKKTQKEKMAIEWWNMGTQLQVEKCAQFEVSVSIDKYLDKPLTKTGKITVERSKN